MINREAVLMAVKMLSEEKNIGPEVTFEALKDGLIRAYHKEVDPAATVEVDINPNTGEIKLFNCKKVVKSEKEIEDDMTELTLAQIKEMGESVKEGEIFRVEYDFSDSFSRIGTQIVAQTLKQKLREVEKENIHSNYSRKIGEIVLAQVESISRAGTLFSIENVPAFMPTNRGINNEKLKLGTNVYVAITDVTLESKGAQILVSRISPLFVKQAMMTEIPEVSDGTIEIIWIQREPGIRSKVVVKSNDDTIDPIGACVGKGGQRIRFVENLITSGERVEIAKYSEDTIELIKSIFSPTPIISINEQEKIIEIIVPDTKYSLALASRALNGKLASSMLEKKVWIYKESEIDGEKIINYDNAGYSIPIAETEEKSVSEEEINFAEPIIEISPITEFTETEQENSEIIKDPEEFTFDAPKESEDYKEEFDFDDGEKFEDEDDQFSDYDNDEMYDD